MSKHTCGPWRARSTGRDVVVEADDPAGISAAPFQIAIVTCGDFTDATGTAKRINSANAALIAAAPELLEALKEALAVDEETVIGGKGCDTYSQRYKAAREKARAAIAKATGEQP